MKTIEIEELEGDVKRNDLAVYNQGYKEGKKQRDAEVKKVIEKWAKEYRLDVDYKDMMKELLQELGLEDGK